VDFEDKRYPLGGLGFEEWQKEKLNLGLDFPNLPYYIDGDIKLTQSLAITRYLGQKHGLDGKTDEQRRRVLVAEQQSVDFRDKFKSFVISSEYDTGKEEFLESVQPMFQQWEKFLGDKKYLIGDDVTYVDFLVYEALDYYRLFHKSILHDYPSLKAYFNRMKNLPELQKYVKSSVRKPWPVFGPNAKFGGGGDPPNHL
ncbi:Glutathione S-transferase class-mu isozyme 7, partial [Araneus ventricosus]